MNIALSCDHRGKHLYEPIKKAIQELGHNVIDVATCDSNAADYPDLAWHTGQAVSNNTADRGILICGTGIGMSIAANKIHGIRAALVHDDIGAEMSRRHNDANILCMSADLLGQRLIEKIVEIFLTVEFEGGRHTRRNNKVTAIEKGDDPTVITE